MTKTRENGSLDLRFLMRPSIACCELANSSSGLASFRGEMAQTRIDLRGHDVDLCWINFCELGDAFQVCPRMFEQVCVVDFEELNIWTVTQKIDNTASMFFQASRHF